MGEKKDDVLTGQQINVTAEDTITKMVGQIASEALKQVVTLEALTEFGDKLVKAISESNANLVKALTETKKPEENANNDQDNTNSNDDGNKTDEVKKSKDEKNTKTNDNKDKDENNEKDLVKSAVSAVLKELGISNDGSMRKSYIVANDGKLVKGVDSPPDGGQEIDINSISMEEWQALPEATRQSIMANEFSARMLPIAQ